MKTKNIIKKCMLAIIVACFVSVTAFSQPLDLRDEPLSLSQSVPPGMVVTVDDSGSMRWGYMPDDRFNGKTKGYYNNWNDNQKVISFTSPQYNAIYYDPTLVYKPPVNEEGVPFPHSIYTNAAVDGYGGATNLANVNLSTDYIPVTEIYPSKSALGVATWRTHKKTTKQGAYYHIWNEALPVPTTTTYFETMRNAGVGTSSKSYTKHSLSSGTAEQKQNFANWYTYYNTRNKLAKAALSRAFVQFGADFKLTWQVFWDGTLDGNSQSSNMDLFEGDHRKDFYDWLFGIRATDGTPLRKATMLAGKEFSKTGTGTVPTDSPYWSEVHQQEMSCQQNFHIQLSDGYWNSSSGLISNYDYEDVTFPTITNGLKSTDPGYKGKTYSYNARATAPQKIYSASPADSLSDNAFYYWSRDLRSDLINNVPTYLEESIDHNGAAVVYPDDQTWWQQSELFWNPRNDPAQWQHMVNFNIGLGVDGQFNQITDYPKLRDGTLSWQNSLQDSTKVDDVWHSSINSRGKYFSAKNPDELVAALDTLINDIIKRTGQGSSGSVSSNILSDVTLAFKTGYNTADWTGSVVAAKLNKDGTLGDAIWDASCKLTGGFCTSLPGNPYVTATKDHSSRHIFTYDTKTKLTHEFHVANLSPLQKQQLLNSNYITDSIANGLNYTADDLVSYIRGDRTFESNLGGSFRKRNSLLGDVIHSPARVLRGPSATYVDDYWYDGSPEQIAVTNGKSYSKFKNDNKNRDNILIVGGNDGMLHAFNAGINTTNGGDELWAYIPSGVLDGLSEIANPSYKHKSFVDASPTIRDAYLGTGANGKWSTIALGGLRHGGKSFYALNLGNDPKLPPTVLWEFSNLNDPIDMGFSYSGGVIARVVAPLNSTGLQSKWVAFVPNGYNSNSHKSALYAIDLETGDVLHKWRTTFGSETYPNGMGPVTAADYVVYDKSDTSQTYYGSDIGTDFLYAGDLHGNLYRFDATKIFTNPGGVTTNPHILFDGPKNKSITVAPRVFTAEDGSQNVIVTFGTGKYIEPSDKSLNIAAQFLIGVKDKKGNTTTNTLSDLVAQKITQTGQTRTLSSKHVNVDQGWKINLRVKVDGIVKKGERLVNGIVRNNQSKDMIVATIIPAGTDPCLPGGISWLMIIDARTGGAPETSLLDAGKADGILINDIITGVNVLVRPGGNESIITLDGTGGFDGDSVIPPIIQASGEKWRRRSWHRILF